MSRTTQILLLLLAFVLANALSATAQVNAENRTIVVAPNRPPEIQNSGIYGGYLIGVGDILDIHVNDEDDVSGRYQVGEDGNVKIPLLSKPIAAGSSTTFELASRLSDELKKEDILREPSVTVMILREMTQNVSVLGAVMRPGVYPIEKPTTLVDVISLAGGLAPNAGNFLTITHNAGTRGTNGLDSSATPNATTSASINITALLSAKDPTANLSVHAGDVVTVGTAPVVFVVGSVGKPGAFAVQDSKSQMTVLQAVAMAEGPTPTASLSRTLIIRQSSSASDRQEIPIDLKRVLRGKDKDQVLEANDILFVPQSGLKAGARRMGDIGAQAAVSMAGYALVF